jgi:uncharacterized membrane protein YkoI
MLAAFTQSTSKEDRMRSIRSKLVTVAAVGAAALGGGAIANAATSSTASSSSSTTRSHQAHTVNGKTEKPLTGAVESKVRAAALAKVPGTVERVETNVDSSAPYEAHIRKADGTEVEVQVGSDYTVSAVNTMGGHP